jgi:hypothetical protein
LLDFVLLCAFVIFNFFVLRWCVRQVIVDGQWLREPGERDEILRQFSLDEIRQLWSPFRRDELPSNPATRLLGRLALIVVILWADRFTLHAQWPWIFGG